jgi:predicted kinase
MTMSQKLVIFAGLPGSGKSTLADAGTSAHPSERLLAIDYLA